MFVFLALLSSRCKLLQNFYRRARFRVRADEQIRADLEQKLSNKGGEKESQAAGEKKRFGPVGTINKVLLDEDIPGLGRWYCEVCSR